MSWWKKLIVWLVQEAVEEVVKRKKGDADGAP